MTPTRTSLTRKTTTLRVPGLDLDGLRRAAAALAAETAAGDVVLLRGGLGAGKTAFARALVAALRGGGDDPVSSPTFVVRQTYPGMPPVEHLDLYRVDDPAELPDLALDDAFGPDRITLVEWPERAPRGWLPPSTVEITLEGAGDAPRTLTVTR